MSALTPALADPGPMVMMAQALQQRLQAAFPPAYFSFAFMPARADTKWFEKYCPRQPSVAIGWNGSRGIKQDGQPWTAEASWTVALITKNTAGPQQRYMGDAMAPGLFAMQRVATIILHGWVAVPAGCEPDYIVGTTIVNGAGNLYNEEFGDRDVALCALDVTIAYQEMQPPGLEPNLPSDGTLSEFITWNFGEQPPLLTQTIETGS